ALLDDRNLTLDDTVGPPAYLLSLETAAYTDSVPQGTYPVQVAVTDGPADPADVSGAHTIEFEVNEGPEQEVDKDDLEAAIEDANTYDSEDYTEESFAQLETALEEAEQVMSDEDATQDEVDAARSEEHTSELQSRFDLV